MKINIELIKNACRTIIEGFDMDDKFGDDIDTRHHAEEAGLAATHTILAHLEALEQEPKYEYYLYTWGGFYNKEHNHGFKGGKRWFDTKEEREKYIDNLYKVSEDMNAKVLCCARAEGYHTREVPTIHRITEWNGERRYHTYEWSWPESIEVIQYHAKWKWYPGFNHYPFGDDFDYEANEVKIVKEWITGAFENSQTEFYNN